MKIPETVTIISFNVRKEMRTGPGHEDCLVSGLTEDWTIRWNNKMNSPNAQINGMTQSTKRMVSESLNLSQKGINFQFDNLTKETNFGISLSNPASVTELIQNLVTHIINQEMKEIAIKSPNSRSTAEKNVSQHEPNDASPEALASTSSVGIRNPNVTRERTSGPLTAAERASKMAAILASNDDDEDIKPQAAQVLMDDVSTANSSESVQSDSVVNFVPFGGQDKDEPEQPKTPKKATISRKKPLKT